MDRDTKFYVFLLVAPLSGYFIYVALVLSFAYASNKSACEEFGALAKARTYYSAQTKCLVETKDGRFQSVGA